MPRGLFTLKQQLQGVQQKAWNAAPTFAGSWGGSSSTYLSFTGNSNLAFGTGNFTIEGWFLRASSVTGTPALICGGGSGNWAVLIGGGTLYFQNSQSVSNLLNISATMLQNVWYHLAVVRNSGTTTMYLNGSSIGSAADSTNYSASTPTYYIGANPDNLTSYVWNGLLSNIRVNKGTALYTANFTPPVGQLANVSGTQFLGLQNSTIIDNSANSFSITTTGSVSIQAANPFTQLSTPAVDYLVVAGGGGGCITYGGGGGGAGGLLQGSVPVASGTSYTVTVGSGGTNQNDGSNSVFGNISALGGGRGDGWNNVGYPGGSGGGGGGGSATFVGGQGRFGQGNAGGTAFGILAYAGSGGGGAGTVGLNSSATAAGNGGAGIASAISGTITTYAGGGGGGVYATATVAGIGGVGGGGSGSLSTTPTAGTANTGGGGGGTGGPTSAPYANGGSGIVIVSYPDIYAGAASTTGSPTVSTSGSGSIYFNGSSGVTYPSATQFDLFGSSFTIQFWMYMTATTGYRTIICKRPAGSGPSYSLKIPTGSNSLAFGNTSAETAFSGSVTYNTWMHIAIVCDGTNTKLYMNGVFDSTVALAATSNNSVALAIGGNVNNGNEYMTGYISNLQLLKGVQLYTANFTPSTYPVVNNNGTNTSLLMNTATPYVAGDNSTFANSYTLSGSPSFSSLTPFSQGRGLQNRVYTYTGSGTITF